MVTIAIIFNSHLLIKFFGLAYSDFEFRLKSQLSLVL